MRVKAIKDLSQLSDTDLFVVVADGMKLVLDHARKLFAASSEVARSDEQASRVLAAVAEEESTKFLILLDSIRCPRTPAERWANQLGRFNDHLAKGLYAKVYEIRPATVGEVQSYIDMHRDNFYLDGPNDVDWIFPNEVLHERERTFYVDYVASDDGSGWLDPRRHEGMFSVEPMEPRALVISNNLQAAGVADPVGLAVVADVWRSETFELSTRWGTIADLNARTLTELASRGVTSTPDPDRDARTVDEWQPPLYGLDLSKRKVELESLRERQRRWSPD